MELLLIALLGTGLLIGAGHALGFSGKARIEGEADVAAALAALSRPATPVAIAIGAGGRHALARARDGRLLAVFAMGDRVGANAVDATQVARAPGGARVAGDFGHPAFAILAPEAALDAVLSPVDLSETGAT